MSDKDKLMQYIAQMESSGGKFRNQPEVNSGIQAGTHAISSYGIMPNTAYEMVQRNKPFQSTPVGAALLETQGDPDQINAITADPYADHETMSGLLDDTAQRLSPYLDKDDNPDAAMLYAHRRGVNAAIDALQQGNKDYENDPYVQPYFQDDVNKQNIDPNTAAKMDALKMLSNPEE